MYVIIVPLVMKFWVEGSLGWYCGALEDNFSLYLKAFGFIGAWVSLTSQPPLTMSKHLNPLITHLSTLLRSDAISQHNFFGWLNDLDL